MSSPAAQASITDAKLTVEAMEAHVARHDQRARAAQGAAIVP